MPSLKHKITGLERQNLRCGLRDVSNAVGANICYLLQIFREWISLTPCSPPGGVWATERVLLHAVATHAAFILGNREAIQLLRTSSCHFWVLYALCSGEVLWPFLLSFSLWFCFCLLKKSSPLDLDLPVKFFLSHIGGEERHGKLIVEQDRSRRRREKRGCLGQHLPDRWMGRGGFHLLATTFTRLDAHEFISLEICGKSSHRYH